jgi:hypothetical protein
MNAGDIKTIQSSGASAMNTGNHFGRVSSMNDQNKWR